MYLSELPKNKISIHICVSKIGHYHQFSPEFELSVSLPSLGHTTPTHSSEPEHQYKASQLPAQDMFTVDRPTTRIEHFLTQRHQRVLVEDVASLLVLVDSGRKALSLAQHSSY